MRDNNLLLVCRIVVMMDDMKQSNLNSQPDDKS